MSICKSSLPVFCLPSLLKSKNYADTPAFSESENIFPGRACNEKYIFVTTCQYFSCVIATATK